MDSKTTSRRIQRRDHLRNEILDVASRLFSERGYQNVTLRAIAKEIGYSHASIYQHFPDKSHILAEICQETFSLLIKEIDDVVKSIAPPSEQLITASHRLARFCIDHPQHMRVVFFGPADRNGVRVGEYIDQVGKPLFNRLQRIFANCVKAGEFKVANTQLAARSWWCSVMGLSMVIIIQGELPGYSKPQAIVHQLIQMLWTGISRSHQLPC